MVQLLRPTPVACQSASTLPRGFTLLEVVLVLALLVLLAAAVVPALEGPFASMRVRDSAQELRAAWTQARVRAMSTGVILAFKFQEGTGHYRVEPYQAQQAEEGALPTGDQMSEYDFQQANQAVEGTLPEDVKFIVSRIEQDSRNLAVMNYAPTAGPQGTVQWSLPILFYPDGTTSSASVSIGNDRDQHILLVLRGLTGTSSASDILAASELP